MSISTRKLREKSEKVYKDDGIDDDDIEGTRNFDVEEKLKSDEYDADFVQEMSGSDFTVEYFQRSGNKYPIIFRERTGLGLRTPSENFRVSDVKRCVGSRRMLDVMDVETQKGLEMTLREWEAYYENPHRERLLNVISLEFSHTRLDQYIDAPSVVRQIDFINCVWPQHLKECQSETTNILEKMMYPKVQKYCLMSVGNCYTDFHVDFGGTSVWYNLLHGEKVFWLIEPTDENLELYVEWVLSGKQGDVFFADKVAKCQRVHLMQGDTFVIPSGWIHGVFTPVDSLVFGGNFLHSYNLVEQLKVANIEDRTHVPAKFRFPFFTEMMWYVLAQYVRCLTGHNHFIPPETDDEKTIVKTEPADKKYVHLTPYEIDGLSEVVIWLENLPTTKKSIPKDLRDVNSLLEQIKDLLRIHQNDDPELAINNAIPICWPEVRFKKQKKARALSLGGSTGGGKNKPAKVINLNRRRRTRCKKCEACQRDDCGECTFCQDMRKYGGPGRMKQSCKSRQCMAPMLPASALCQICGEDSSVGDTDDAYDLLLMECGICWEISHPLCLRGKDDDLCGGNGVLNDALPNSWECPKCCHAGKAGQLKPRVVKGAKMSTSESLIDAIQMDETCVSSLTGNDEELEEESFMDDASETSEKPHSSDILLLLEHTMDTTNLDHSYSDRSPSPERRQPSENMEDDDDEMKELSDLSHQMEDFVVKAEVTADIKVEVTADMKAEVKAKVKAEVKAEVKVEVKAEVTEDANDLAKDSPASTKDVKSQNVAVTKQSPETPTASTAEQSPDRPQSSSKTEQSAVSTNSGSVAKRKYARKSRTIVHEGKRVTMHGNRVMADLDVAVLSRKELETCKKAGVVLQRIKDVTPILEKYGCMSSDDRTPVKSTLAKSTLAKSTLAKSTLVSSKKLTAKSTTDTQSTSKATKLSSSSESEGDNSSKRPRREVVMPKRYLE